MAGKISNYDSAPNAGINGAAARSARRKKFAKPAAVSPATGCERQYTDEETTVLAAIADYKKQTGHQFPTVCEILAVLKRLGYAKVQPC